MTDFERIQEALNLLIGVSQKHIRDDPVFESISNLRGEIRRLK